MWTWFEQSCARRVVLDAAQTRREYTSRMLEGEYTSRMLEATRIM